MPRSPRVPAAADLDPLPHVWPAGKQLTRVYSAEFGPLGFNPSSAAGRFRPVLDGGAVVPTVYAGVDPETALAEGLLRGVDAIEADLAPRLYQREVREKRLARMVATRDLTLARLNGPGLTRLGISRKRLIEVPAPAYPYTAEWAQALYDCAPRFDGLLWTSHQSDDGEAILLWEGRVDADADLEGDGDPLALDSEPGLDLVREACLRAGVHFEG
jgi:RES domain